MRKFEKKYCYKKRCFDVDKNLKKQHLDKINSNRKIRVVSVSGGFESPAHINFEMGLQNDAVKVERFLKKKIPNSEIECFGWSRTATRSYGLDNRNRDYKGKKRRPTEKVCNVVSKKKKSTAWWKKASDVVGSL